MDRDLLIIGFTLAVIVFCTLVGLHMINRKLDRLLLFTKPHKEEDSNHANST